MINPPNNQRTFTAGQLIALLSTANPNTPVVIGNDSEYGSDITGANTAVMLLDNHELLRYQKLGRLTNPDGDKIVAAGRDGSADVFVLNI